MMQWTLTTAIDLKYCTTRKSEKPRVILRFLVVQKSEKLNFGLFVFSDFRILQKVELPEPTADSFSPLLYVMRCSRLFWYEFIIQRFLQKKITNYNFWISIDNEDLQTRVFPEKGESVEQRPLSTQSTQRQSKQSPTKQPELLLLVEFKNRKGDVCNLYIYKVV